MLIMAANIILLTFYIRIIDIFISKFASLSYQQHRTRQDCTKVG